MNQQNDLIRQKTKNDKPKIERTFIMSNLYYSQTKRKRYTTNTKWRKYLTQLILSHFLFIKYTVTREYEER